MRRMRDLRNWLALASVLLPVLLLCFAGRRTPAVQRIATRQDPIAILADDFRHAGPILAAQQSASTETPLVDNGLEVPWNGVLWQSMPEFTWAACDVSPNTRAVIDEAVGQWAYAAASQGMPIHLSELSCADGATQAQIRIVEGTSRQLASFLGYADVDVFGLTLVRDGSNRVCGIEVVGACVAQAARIYLFADNWQSFGLSNAQEAKTTAHEIGHAVGLAHAHFCNYDSVMAQSCEPLLQGLGGDDIQSLDALADSVRAYFQAPPLSASLQSPWASGTGKAVTYHAGWNLVAGPRGTDLSAASGSLYTMVSGDKTYRSVPASQSTYSAYGYWAYFPQDVTVQLNGSGRSFYSALTTPGHWFMIGNASGTTAMHVLYGADAVYTWDAQNGQYVSSTTLQPGEAAWVKPDRRGEVVVASTSLSRDQINCYRNLGDPTSC